MMHSGQFLGQRQSMQQRLSPQQIQYIKLLQLPTMSMEMRIKEEMEQNPLLEEITDVDVYEERRDEDSDSKKDETESTDELSEIDWDSILHDDNYEGKTYTNSSSEDWVDLPDPYLENLLENLEKQVYLLQLDDTEQLIAEQIIGSIDEDGYLRRELSAIVDSIIFSTGHSISPQKAEAVLKKIQRLDPPGIAAQNLQECLLAQLELRHTKETGRDIAIRILTDEWDSFEKKHFDKVKKRLNLTDEQLLQAYDCIQNLDPKPGGKSQADESHSYIVPDFTVYYEPENMESDQGDFLITLNRRNQPSLRISGIYKQMWDKLKQKSSRTENDKETRSFIKTKMKAARSFMDAIQQRSQTLINVMKTIVSLQETFFRHGTTLRPMILKDVAERIGMDISTVSRVVNGKYVQTEFGVFELKYFFNEGIETNDGESASNRDVKNFILDLIQKEDNQRPLSDDAITQSLNESGYKLARRTVSKYREQLSIPVARLRKKL